MLFKTSYKKKLSGCVRIRDTFSEYLDGVLSEDERHFVHDHLRLCADCSKELDLLNQTLSALAEFREDSLPSGFQNYRVPRSTFFEIFPTIREEQQEISVGLWAPYVSVFLLFFILVVSRVSWERHLENHEKAHQNASNYIEVIAES